MKICTICNKQKDLSEYYVRDKNTGRLHAQCKTCYKTQRENYYSEHYKKYGEEYKKRAKERRKQVQIRLRSNMLDYLKDKQCNICGFSDIRVLEFDHIEPQTKKFGIARAMGDGVKWSDILIEISKCRVLCANCHKIVTSEQQGWYKL